ncbi:cation:dicarboxylase symporter family transporter [Pseudohongiella sp. SYSU M77423]|uniref:L-cystine transporter n=1 Tax=unclassified Pseudohongiella TaxID=2629611 RepID=UPI001F01609B|nr:MULTISPECIES: cation:dicarboxylase symporter family transporter [unclassified Pseudohongiella]MDH7944300.1 cation:dicarboxylase symporter family transporter [Pseudohongiella sp. SYSU M77423]MEC8860933.1 cation:dicarboxylase symporter family transporter [Pseudomonadota bacterium]
MSMLNVLGIIIFVALLYALYKLRRPDTSLAKQVFIALAMGVVFGLFLQIIHGGNIDEIRPTLTWTDLPGDIYVALLRMIIIPLVLVTMIAAVVRLHEVAALGKIGGSVIGILVFTTMIAAIVGIVVTNLFGLTAEGMVGGAREAARVEFLESRAPMVEGLTFAQVIVNFIPTNIFRDLTEARSTSIIAVVIFGMLFGLAALLVSREKPEYSDRIKGGTETIQAIVMRLVKMIMGLTPYGILSLVTYVVAGSNGSDILNLIGFVVASYIALGIMFGVHGLLLSLTGNNPAEFYRKIWPVLTFAFATRSSAATIPLNIRTQVDELKVPPSIASLSASFGATIGQNGCAGIYPAMLAVMAAPTVGINPMDIGFILSLIGIITISSFGVAGVGGGATFAALIVLPAMGLPVELAALLISIEPLIDMGRTALNVSGAMTSGKITSTFIKEGV